MSLPKIKFPEDNNIVFGQDFSWFAGVPSDVEFEIYDVAYDKMWLRAPGYGILDGKEGDYGNGSIVVYFQTDKEKIQL